MISTAVILTLAMASVSARLYDLRTNTRLDAQFEFSLIGRGKVKATLPSGEAVSGSYVTAKNRTEFWGTLYGRNGGQVGGISQGTQYGTVEAVGDRGTTFLCEYVVVGNVSGFGSCEDSRGGKYRLIFGGDAPEPPKAPPPSKIASIAGLTDGFRDLRWGQPVPRGMVLQSTERQATFYRRPADEPKFGGFEVRATTYVFIKEGFAGASLEFEPSACPQVRQRLTEAWGSAPTVKNPSGSFRVDTWYARNAGSNDTQAELNSSTAQDLVGLGCSLVVSNWAVAKPYLDAEFNRLGIDAGTSSSGVAPEIPGTGPDRGAPAEGAAALKDGFRDLRWGLPLPANMVFAYALQPGDPGAKLFTRAGDKFSLGPHQLSRIEYLFIYGRFAGAFLGLASGACIPLSQDLRGSWGTPTEEPIPHRGETSFSWYSPNSGHNDTRARLYYWKFPDRDSLSEADRRLFDSARAEIEKRGTGCTLVITNPSTVDPYMGTSAKSTIDKDL